MPERWHCRRLMRPMQRLRQLQRQSRQMGSRTEWGTESATGMQPQEMGLRSQEMGLRSQERAPAPVMMEVGAHRRDCLRMKVAGGDHNLPTLFFTACIDVRVGWGGIRYEMQVRKLHLGGGWTGEEGPLPKGTCLRLLLRPQALTESREEDMKGVRDTVGEMEGEDREFQEEGKKGVKDKAGEMETGGEGGGECREEGMKVGVQKGEEVQEEGGSREEESQEEGRRGEGCQEEGSQQEETREEGSQEMVTRKEETWVGSLRLPGLERWPGQMPEQCPLLRPVRMPEPEPMPARV